MLFDAIHIYVPDLNKAFDFYHTLFNFPIREHSQTSLCIIAGKSQLHFHLSAKQHGPYHFAFHVPNNQLQAALQWVSNKTSILKTGPGENIADFTNWNAKSFYFLDPFKNILECITHYDLEMHTRAFDGSKDVTHIIEAGIVTTDVMATCKQLQHDHQLEYFTKGPVTENFAVMGNEGGMLIVSKEGRHWYPTDQAAMCTEIHFLITHLDRQFTFSGSTLR